MSKRTLVRFNPATVSIFDTDSKNPEASVMATLNDFQLFSQADNGNEWAMWELQRRGVTSLPARPNPRKSSKSSVIPAKPAPVVYKPAPVVVRDIPRLERDLQAVLGAISIKKLSDGTAIEIPGGGLSVEAGKKVLTAVRQHDFEVWGIARFPALTRLYFDTPHAVAKMRGQNRAILNPGTGAAWQNLNPLEKELQRIQKTIEVKVKLGGPVVDIPGPPVSDAKEKRVLAVLEKHGFALWSFVKGPDLTRLYFDTAEVVAQLKSRAKNNPPSRARKNGVREVVGLTGYVVVDNQGRLAGYGEKQEEIVEDVLAYDREHHAFERPFRVWQTEELTTPSSRSYRSPVDRVVYNPDRARNNPLPTPQLWDIKRKCSKCGDVINAGSKSMLFQKKLCYPCYTGIPKEFFAPDMRNLKEQTIAKSNPQGMNMTMILSESNIPPRESGLGGEWARWAEDREGIMRRNPKTKFGAEGGYFNGSEDGWMYRGWADLNGKRRYTSGYTSESTHALELARRLAHQNDVVARKATFHTRTVANPKDEITYGVEGGYFEGPDGEYLYRSYIDTDGVRRYMKHLYTKKAQALREVRKAAGYVRSTS